MPTTYFVEHCQTPDDFCVSLLSFGESPGNPVLGTLSIDATFSLRAENEFCRGYNAEHVVQAAFEFAMEGYVANKNEPHWVALRRAASVWDSRRSSGLPGAA